MRSLNRIEIVVLALVGMVLLALVAPWFLETREKSRLHTCTDNLRQIRVGLENDQQFQKKMFPFGTVPVRDLPPEKRLAWTVPVSRLIPPGGKSTFDFSEGWQSETNRRPLLNGSPFHRNPRFHCPKDETDSPPDKLQYSSYVGITGIGKDSLTSTALSPSNGLWGYARRTRFRDITAGTGHTLCILETSRNNGPWTAGGPFTLRPLLPEETPFIGPGRQFGGHHVEGCVTLFADGSGRTLSNRTDAAVFASMCTIAREKPPAKTPATQP